MAYGGGHIRALLPVALRMHREGNADVRVLALTTAGAVARGSGVPTLGFADLARPEDAAALTLGRRLAADLPAGPVPAEESHAYLGLSYAELRARLGEQGARGRYRERGRAAFLPTPVLRRWFADWRPDLVVTTNSPRAERAALIAARELGIPSVCLLDLFGIQDRDVLARPGYGDRLCVLSPAVRDAMVEAGRPGQEVVVTGNPAFDRIDSEENRRAGAQLRKRRGWGPAPVVLWATQPLTSAADRAERARAEASLATLAEAGRWRVVVRPHPSEPPSGVADVTGAEPSPQSEPLHALLHAVDLVVTVASTVGLEAAIAGTPVLQLTGTSLARNAPLAELGMAYPVPHGESLVDAIHAAEGAGPPPEASSLSRSDATDRVLAVIAELLPREIAPPSWAKEERE